MKPSILFFSALAMIVTPQLHAGPQAVQGVDKTATEVRVRYADGVLVLRPLADDTVRVRFGASQVQYSTEKPDAPYEIRVYPGADGRFTIYENDNEQALLGHQRQRCARARTQALAVPRLERWHELDHAQAAPADPWTRGTGFFSTITPG